MFRGAGRCCGVCLMSICVVGDVADCSGADRAQAFLRRDEAVNHLMVGVLARATRQDREERYPTVRAFVQAFEGAVTD